jgi:glycerate kinase
MVHGASFVLDVVGFDARARKSLAVVTGEGKLDHQSLAGKAVSWAGTRRTGLAVGRQPAV